MKLSKGITTTWQNKPKTLPEYIEYRNMILLKAENRTAKFRDRGFNYYWLRLQEIDMQYPEFKGLGKIHLKEAK
jgi:hypothetical protein